MEDPHNDYALSCFLYIYILKNMQFSIYSFKVYNVFRANA